MREKIQWYDMIKNQNRGLYIDCRINLPWGGDIWAETKITRMNLPYQGTETSRQQQEQVQMLQGRDNVGMFKRKKVNGAREKSLTSGERLWQGQIILATVQNLDFIL